MSPDASGGSDWLPVPMVPVYIYANISYRARVHTNSNNFQASICLYLAYMY